MPLMGWDAFTAVYRKPFVLVATLEVTGRQSRFEILQRLLRSLKLAGMFAMYRGERVIRVACAVEADAVAVAKAVNARKQEEAMAEGLAPSWEFAMDEAGAARLKAMLEPMKRSPVVDRRGKRKTPW